MNLISGNGNDGIDVNASDDTKIQGNYIGTDATGSAQLGNTLSGVLIENGAQNNTIGGTDAETGNVITDGVRIDGTALARILPGISSRATSLAPMPPAKPRSEGAILTLVC